MSKAQGAGVGRIRVNGSGVRQRWNAYFALATPLLMLAIVIFSHQEWYLRVLLMVLLGAPTAFYLLLIDRHCEEMAHGASKSGARGWLFAAVVLICMILAEWIDPSVMYVQFIVIPQIFIAFRYWPALGIVSAMNVGFVVMSFFPSIGVDRSSTTEVVVESLGSIFFSAMIGIANDRLSEVNNHNIQLIERLESQQELIRNLSHEEGIAAERQRIAGEMHDTIAQSLTSVLALSRAAVSELDEGHESALALKHMHMVSAIAKESLDDTRALIANSTPVALQESSLKDALHRTLAGIEHGDDRDCDLQIDADLPVLPLALQVAVLRIVQEAVTNIQKYSHAHHVKVNLGRSGDMKAKGQLGSEQDWLCLNIADDGVGFDVSAMSQTQARTTGHGYGFIDMRRRVEEFSGTFIFDSEPGKGTRLTALFPMNTEQETLAEGSIRL